MSSIQELKIELDQLKTEFTGLQTNLTQLKDELKTNLNELKNAWMINTELKVGNDPNNRVTIKEGNVNANDLFVKTNVGNEESIKEHIGNRDAHKSLPITGGNLKYMDDPNPHVIEQDPEKDGS